MRHFYYIKTADKELVYQDEEVMAPETIVAVKTATGKTLVGDELKAEVTLHKSFLYDSKTETAFEVGAEDTTCLLKWDGTSPYYQVIKGTAPEAVPFLGWPQVSKESYVEPVDEPIKEIVEKVSEEVIVATPEDLPM